ncbi:MAG: Holliday junction resolvase RuvX [Candidatus Omnitrophica bacterium]|nr:Holliday junction resolvase RuvX [Candidatus Omnitrophota bacterium]
MNAALLGLDLGEKRVGVAIVPAGTSLAFPLKTILRQGREKFAAEVQALVHAHKVEKIVIGFPRTLKGAIGPAAQKVADDTEWLKTKWSAPVVFWDEWLSTKEAERVLLEADVSRSKRKEVIDQLAAQRVLQSYVDSQRKQGTAF